MATRRGGRGRSRASLSRCLGRIVMSLEEEIVLVYKNTQAVIAGPQVVVALPQRVGVDG